MEALAVKQQLGAQAVLGVLQAQVQMVVQAPVAALVIRVIQGLAETQALQVV